MDKSKKITNQRNISNVLAKNFGYNKSVINTQNAK